MINLLNTSKSISAVCGLMIIMVNPAIAQEHKFRNGFYSGIFGLSAKETVSGTSLKADGQIGGNASDETANSSFNGNGLGMLVGYRNVSNNGLVIGIEGDLSQLNLKGNQNTLVNTIGSPYEGMMMASNLRETKWASTIRFISGYTSGSWLFNLSGGVAIASMEESRTQYRGYLGPNRTEAQFTEHSKSTPLGLAYGFSGAKKISKQLSLRADYLVLKFNDVEYGFADARGGVANNYTSVQGRQIDNDIKIKTLRFGLLYSY